MNAKEKKRSYACDICYTRHDKSNGVFAFTLIELLVVISIISLLVSILLPSLTKAKDLAKISVCTSQLHTWGVAHHLYANDNNDSFKVFYENDAVDPGSRGDWGSPEVVRRSEFVDLFINYYGITQAGFYCPMNPDVKSCWVIWESVPAGPYAKLGYTYLGGYPSWANSFFLNDYATPVTLGQSESWWVLMTDLARGFDAWQTNHWFDGDFGSATLCVDGHVEHHTDDLEVQFEFAPGYRVFWKHTR